MHITAIINIFWVQVFSSASHILLDLVEIKKLYKLQIELKDYKIQLEPNVLISIIDSSLLEVHQTTTI